MSIVLSTEEIEALPPHAFHAWWQKAPREHWEHMVMHPDKIQSHRAIDTHEATNEAGIYMLFGADGGLDYIGKSKDISKRMREHLMAMVDMRRPPYSRFAWMELPSYAYHDIEVAHIYAMEPPHNRLYEPPRWGRHKELVSLVQEAWGYKE